MAGLTSLPRTMNIKGQPHKLAYITEDESNLLKSRGGAGRPMEGTKGVPTYFDVGEGMEGYDSGSPGSADTAGGLGDPDEGERGEDILSYFDQGVGRGVDEAEPTNIEGFMDALSGYGAATRGIEDYYASQFDPDTPVSPLTASYPTFSSGLTAIGRGAMDLTDFLYEGLANLSPLGFTLSALGLTDTSEIGKSFGEYTGIRGTTSLVDNVLDYFDKDKDKDEDKDEDKDKQVGPSDYMAMAQAGLEQSRTSVPQDPSPQTTNQETPAPDSISQEVATQQTEAPASTPSLSDVYDYGFPDSGGVPLAPPIPSVPTVAPEPATEVVTPEPRVRTAAENTRSILEGIYGKQITDNLLPPRTDLSRIV